MFVCETDPRVYGAPGVELGTGLFCCLGKGEVGEERLVGGGGGGG